MYLKIFYFITFFLLSSPQAFSSDKKEDSPGKCRKAVNSLSESEEGINTEKPTEELLSVLLLPLKSLGLSVHAYRSLKESGIKRLWDLVQMTEQQLLSIPNFGKISLNQVKVKLSKKDLSLKMEFEEHLRAKYLETLEKERSVKEEMPPQVPFIVEFYPILALPIQSLNFPIPSYDDLENNNINYVGDFIQKTEEELISKLNLGIENLYEAKALLSKRGLWFGMLFVNWPPPPKMLKELGIVARKIHSRVLYHPQLTPIEKEVLKMRFAIQDKDTQTSKEVRQVFDLSEQAISRIERETLQKLYRFARYSLGMEDITSPDLMNQDHVEELLKRLDERKKKLLY